MARMGAVRRITVVLVCAGAWACTPESPAPSPPSAPAVETDGTVPCDSVIGGSATPPADWEVVLDSVALPVGRTLDAAPTGGAGSPRLFAKQGLLVRAGTRPELRIPADWETRAWIGWGPAEPANVVTVSACPPRGSDPWIAFAGGYYVDEPACVPVVERAGGRETTVRIGVGAACAAA